MNSLRLAIIGEERLWKVFAIYGVAGNLVISLLAHEAEVHLGTLLSKLFYILDCLYFILSAILVWSNASNVDRRIWGFVVRLVVIFGIVIQAFFLDYILFIKPLHKVQARTVDEKYRMFCEQNMIGFAKKNGADPQQYIARNQAYINQCIQYYISKDKTEK